ncbi:unnamed protein product [Linum trigynum]|uniref:DUF4283 domain-containing protein n=1 Tax=Linum trigynum TaxID=586398 RepID=A0AAV2ENP6_9ROSI
METLCTNSSVLLASASSSVPLGRPPNNNLIASSFGLPSGNPASPATGVTIEMQVDIEPANVTSPDLGSVTLAKRNGQEITLDNEGGQGVTPSEDRLALPVASYATALTGKGPQTSSAATQWVPVGEHDIISGSFNGEPKLRISEGFKVKLSGPWQRTLVVRLLGKSIGYKTLCNRLKALWRPSGHMEVFAMDRDYFLVKLSNDQDYFKGLSDGHG